WATFPAAGGGPGHDDGLQLILVPSEPAADDRELPIGDLPRQMRHERARPSLLDRPALEQRQRLQARGGSDPYDTSTTPGGVESRAVQDRRDARAHALDQRQKRARQEIERRRRGVVGGRLQASGSTARTR